MPRIQQYEQQSRIAGPSAKSNYAPVEGVSGQALEKLGQTITVLSKSIGETYQSNKTSSAVARAQGEIQAYTQELNNGQGSTDENGAFNPPPDPMTHSDLFEAKSKEIQKRYAGQFGVSESSFDESYNSFAAREHLTVRKNSLDHMKSGIRAGLSDQTEIFATTFVNASDANKPKIQAAAHGAIAMAELRGVITPEEARVHRNKFNHEVLRSGVRKLISANADEAALSLINGEFSGSPMTADNPGTTGLPAEEVQKWVETATRVSERNITKANAQTAHDDAQQRRGQEDLNKATAKKLWQLDATGPGKLTPDIVNADIGNLSVDEYKGLMKRATGKDSVVTDPHTYAAINADILHGADRRKQNEEAYRNGDIDRAAYDHNNSLMESLSPVVQGERWVKRGHEYLRESLIPDKDLATPFAKGIAADANLEFSKWAAKFPNAKAADAEREFKAISESAKTLINKDTISIAQTKPRNLVGTMAVPDIKATLKATIEKYNKDKTLNPEQAQYEYNNQIMHIDKLDRAYKAQLEMKALRDEKAAKQLGNN